MTNEQIISNYLQTAYTDEKLAMLLAHAEDGKLAFYSCCCFAGIPSAIHALQAYEVHIENGLDAGHAERDHELFSAMSAAFCRLAFGGGGADEGDELRRAKLIPLIHAEMQRRTALRGDWLDYTPEETERAARELEIEYGHKGEVA